MAHDSAGSTSSPDSAGEQGPAGLPAAAHVTVNLPAKVWDELTSSARADGITRTEALRRAVWVYLFFVRRLRTGDEVTLERPDGQVERVVFPA